MAAAASSGVQLGDGGGGLMGSGGGSGIVTVVECPACAERGADMPQLVHPSYTGTLRGAISGGKSKMGTDAAAYAAANGLRVRVLQEPVCAFQAVCWLDEDGTKRTANLLELYYADPRRWALSFQLYALSLRADAWREQGVCFGARDPHGPFVLFERGLEGDRVFAIVQRDVGNMTSLEYAMYTRAYNVAAAMAPRMRADLTVFMDTPYELCAARMAVRARTEETGGDVDPGRAARLDAYYRRVHAETRRDVKVLECRGRAVYRVPSDWSDAGEESHNATLAHILERAPKST